MSLLLQRRHGLLATEPEGKTMVTNYSIRMAGRMSPPMNNRLELKLVNNTGVNVECGSTATNAANNNPPATFPYLLLPGQELLVLNDTAGWYARRQDLATTSVLDVFCKVLVS